MTADEMNGKNSDKEKFGKQHAAGRTLAVVHSGRATNPPPTLCRWSDD